MRRVEIYQGNAPVQADRAGIGGAIFFDPERPSNLRPTAGGMLGSFGAKSGWAYAGVGSARSAAAVGIQHEEVANDYAYVSDRGTRFEPGNAQTLRRRNAGVRTTDVWALGTTNIGASGRLDLLFNGVARTQGLAGLAVLPTEQANAAQQRQLAAVAVTVPCGDERCTVTATTATLFGHAITDDPLEERGLGSRRLESTAARVDESIFVRVGLSKRVALTSVVRGAVEHLAINSATARLLRARRFTTTGAALVEWSVSRFATLRALTHVACDATGSGTSRDANGASACGAVTPSARAGAEVGSRAVKLLANVARHGRVPTLGERYGISASVRGSEALVPEAAVAGDIGVRCETSVLNVEVFTETISGHVRARVRLANVLDQPRFDLVGFPLSGRALYASMDVQW